MPGQAAVLLGRGRAEARSAWPAEWYGDLPGCIPSPRTRDPVGATEWPLTGNRGACRGAAILVAALALCLTVESRHLCSCETAVLGQKGARCSAARLSPRRGEWVL